MPDNILFSADPARDLEVFLTEKKYSSVVFLTDRNTEKHCLPRLRSAAPGARVISVDAGEEFKSIDTCVAIWEVMTAAALDRHACLIVVGGGVLGDMGGFCAATYKRGIDFVLVPTTLLAQVDASIGGKLGVDFRHFKNHIGVFQLPALTLIHKGFLNTLPAAELRSGFAEVIKHALISDQEKWNAIISNSIEQQDWDDLVRHSVDFKRRVVTEDPREKGLRKILNAGHTIGHAIETHLLNTGRKIMHGEAVAAGLVCEAWLSAKKGVAPATDFGPVYQYILKTFGKVDVKGADFEAIADLTTQDKKNKENRILCVLFEEVGSVRWDVPVSKNDVKESLSFYASLQM